MLDLTDPKPRSLLVSTSPFSIHFSEKDNQLRMPQRISQIGVPLRINAGHVRSQRSPLSGLEMGHASHGRSLHPQNSSWDFDMGSVIGAWARTHGGVHRSCPQAFAPLTCHLTLRSVVDSLSCCIL
jgi:hypothetical protein